MGEFASDYNGLDKKEYFKRNKKGTAFGSEYFTPSMPSDAADRAFKVIKRGTVPQFIGDKAKEGAKFVAKEAGNGGKFLVADTAKISEKAAKGYVKGVSKDTFGDDGGAKVINVESVAEHVADRAIKKHKQKRKAQIKTEQKFSAKMMDAEYTKAIANGDFKRFEEKFKAADSGFNVSSIVRKNGPADSHEAYKAFRKKANQKRFSRKVYRKYHKTPTTEIKNQVKTTASKAVNVVKNVLLELLKKPYVWVIGGITLILIVMFNLFMMIFSSLLSSEQGAGLSSTYLSDDTEIQACETYYKGREDALQVWIDDIETNYPGYDEYDYTDVASIEHNPYVLASYLNAKLHEPFTAAGVKDDMDEFFEKQYKWYTTDDWVEREVHDEDEYGHVLETTHTIKVHVLYVHVKNNGEVKTAYSLLDKEGGQRFSAQVSVKGQKPYLWSGYNIDETDGINVGSRQTYKIPNNILRDDPQFAALYSVGASLIDTPYVWGGTDPSGFDCSGFVSYVYTESGYAYMPRLTAQEIYDRCTTLSADEVMPGDLIFLTGTYATSKDVTHVAIYIGNNMVLNCGDPVKYCNITTGWWKRHFYAWGRYNG